MKNEFQSLNTDIFQSKVVVEPRFVYGGAATEAPNGGCTCDTSGGSVAGGTYTSDTQAYNSDGSTGFKDYQEWASSGSQLDNLCRFCQMIG